MSNLFDIHEEFQQAKADVECYLTTAHELAKAYTEWPNIKRDTLVQMVFAKNEVNQDFMDLMTVWHRQSILDSIHGVRKNPPHPESPKV